MSLDEFPRHFASTFPHLVGARILIALSGGSDSVALTHLLHQASLDLELHAAHVHHGLRGVEADRDAEFCSSLCSELGIPFEVIRLEPPARAPEGREAAWRSARYRALLAAVSRVRAAAVATGHQQDDVAEGVLVQLLRGTGPRGLAGIATEAPEGIVRPLLEWRRSVLRAWLSARDLRWREDSSNRDQELLRNRVRHSILPALETDFPSLRRHLVRLAAALADDEAYLASQLDRLELWIDPSSPSGGVARAAVASLEPALRSRWLHAVAARAGIGRVTRRQLATLDLLLDQGAPRTVTLAGRWRLRLASSRLWLEPPQDPPPYRFDLQEGDRVELPAARLEVRMVHGASACASCTWHWATSAASITVRSPLPGERLGQDETTPRLSAVLARHLPRHLRRAWPVVCVNDRIEWIPGVWQPGATGSHGSLVVEVVRR